MHYLRFVPQPRNGRKSCIGGGKNLLFLCWIVSPSDLIRHRLPQAHEILCEEGVASKSGLKHFFTVENCA